MIWMGELIRIKWWFFQKDNLKVGDYVECNYLLPALQEHLLEA